MEIKLNGGAIMDLLQEMEERFDEFFKEYEKKTDEEIIKDMKEAGFQFAEEENRIKEALPCPFCGSDKIYYIDSDEYIPEYKLICADCRASTDFYNTKEEALAAWNRRMN